MPKNASPNEFSASPDNEDLQSLEGPQAKGRAQSFVVETNGITYAYLNETLQAAGLCLLAQFMHHHFAPSTLDPRLSLFVPFRPYVTMIRCLSLDFWILGQSVVQE